MAKSNLEAPMNASLNPVALRNLAWAIGAASASDNICHMISGQVERLNSFWRFRRFYLQGQLGMTNTVIGSASSETTNLPISSSWPSTWDAAAAWLLETLEAIPDRDTLEKSLLNRTAHAILRDGYPSSSLESQRFGFRMAGFQTLRSATAYFSYVVRVRPDLEAGVAAIANALGKKRLPSDSTELMMYQKRIENAREIICQLAGPVIRSDFHLVAKSSSPSA